MTFMLNPYVFSTTAAAAANMLVFPLTYDEADQNNGNTLSRTGQGPYITPSGFDGDGYATRYLLTRGMPSSVAAAGGKATIQATVKINDVRISPTRETLVYLGENTAAANPKLELAVVNTNEIALRAYTGSSVSSRVIHNSQWRYKFQFPVLNEGTHEARPQGILFLDADTVMVSCHYYSSYESRVYKVRLSDRAVLGVFTFGLVNYRHVAAFARSSNGEIWCVDYYSNKAVQIDVAASFLSGNAVILAVYDLAAMGSPSGIDFVTVNSIEYALIAPYGTTTYLYVIPKSVMVNGGTFALTDRYKRFRVSDLLQGIVVKGNDVYISNSNTNEINKRDIVTAINSLADGATPAVTASWKGPAFTIEDLAFHPTSGEIWTQTEGYSSTSDDNGFLSAWSSPLTGEHLECTYGIEYDGASSITIKLNDLLYDVLPWTITAPGDCLSIGAPPQAAEGYKTGFSVATIKGVVVADGPISSTEYSKVTSGFYEPNTLTTYVATITNPGAESALTGWTNESGGLGTRTATPSPKSGTAYFTGGSSVATVGRQRLSMTAITGLTAAEIDALAGDGKLWGRLTWYQTNYDLSADPGGMGVRYLDATPTQINQTYSPILFNFPSGAWWQRRLLIPVPTGARNVDLLQRMDRTAGTNNDTYIDDIEFKIYRK
jgi:hypothetical protein